jgi:uncharacterized protein YndB with AHSA1/START domain
MPKNDLRDAISKFPVPPVVKTVVVRRRPEDAFSLFTQKLDAWWPLQKFSAAPNASSCTFEARIGGRVFERAADGVETDWGRVEAWEPPRRLVFSWTVGTASADEAQRIEVIFTPVAEGTRVQLTHSGWEKLGARAEAMRNAFDNGWALILEQCFARYADSANSAQG